MKKFLALIIVLVLSFSTVGCSGGIFASLEENNSPPVATPESKPDMCVPEPTPEPTVEVTFNPTEEPEEEVLCDFYSVYGVEFAVPQGFFFNEEVSNDVMAVYHSDWDYTASFIVTLEEIYTNPTAITSDMYQPNYCDGDEYIQDYFVIKNEMAMSHLRYSIDGVYYEDFDITVCLDDCTLTFSMIGPEEYSKTFQWIFDYIGVVNG